MSDGVLAAPGSLRGRLRVEPVAELDVSFPQSVVADAGQDAVDPGLHAVELPGQNLLVAESVGQHGRHHGRGIPPRGSGADREAQHVGDDEGDDAVALDLLEGEVGEPVGQECAAVEERRRGRGEHLDVAGPPHPLVSLRAVCRHGEEVAAHRPDDVLVESVEQVVR